MTANRVSPALWNAWNSFLFWLSLPWWLIQATLGRHDEDEDPDRDDEGWLLESEPAAPAKPGFRAKVSSTLVELFYFFLTIIASIIMVGLTIVIGVPVLAFVVVMDLVTGNDVSWVNPLPTLGERLNPINSIVPATDDPELRP